ncbi:hypothetical protein [Actinomycetospora termitidis]|uniref:Uncharacterized protein n=1 Tax=Actinomycetospora termitidis TaxID=3053470 RepID=A0ABT7MGH3_9PSEU|nr:hypothetical protein [Actinomycetospora sp. Odt1-22]MDL5159755.1 hypothetical protein [Actinomycetospora sp. Odt1-22]
MIILGLARRALGPVVRFATLVLAPVAAVLAWGAVENGRDERRKGTGRTGG